MLVLNKGIEQNRIFGENMKKKKKWNDAFPTQAASDELWFATWFKKKKKKKRKLLNAP